MAVHSPTLPVSDPYSVTLIVPYLAVKEDKYEFAAYHHTGERSANLALTPAVVTRMSLILLECVVMVVVVHIAVKDPIARLRLDVLLPHVVSRGTSSLPRAARARW